MPLLSNPRRRRQTRRRWCVLLLVLLLHAWPASHWPVLNGVSLVSLAHADDDGDDGDDSSDSDGGSASSSSGDSATGGQDTDPGPREPELPVQADSFKADELVALNPSQAALQRVGQWGARVIESSVQADLGLRVVRLRLPPGIDARTALAVASERDPGVFDLHHRYQLAQNEAPAFADCQGASCEPMRRMNWPERSANCGRDQVIGVVDSGVDTRSPALQGADVRVRRFVTDANATGDSQHGTAVVTLLVGQPGTALPGLLPRASLRAAEPFFRLSSGALAADAVGLVKSLEWLVSQQVQVIGMSLTGPDNLVLAAAIQRTQARGVLVAAAVGNGGRNAPPAHPAALNDVLGATAVSADGRIYWRASQGATVDFAVPGVELPTADGPGAVRLRSGTSYAVPFLLAHLSQSLSEGVLSRTDWLEGRNVPVADLGTPGRDPVFGWGLPQVAVRCR
jgi:minor extracellular protease Epr